MPEVHRIEILYNRLVVPEYDITVDDVLEITRLVKNTFRTCSYRGTVPGLIMQSLLKEALGELSVDIVNYMIYPPSQYVVNANERGLENKDLYDRLMETLDKKNPSAYAMAICPMRSTNDTMRAIRKLYYYHMAVTGRYIKTYKQPPSP